MNNTKPAETYAVLRLTNTRLISIDTFIADLWKVHEAVKAEGYVQVRISEEFLSCSRLIFDK